MKRGGFRFIDAISTVDTETDEKDLTRLDKSIIRRINGRDRHARKSINNVKGTVK